MSTLTARGRTGAEAAVTPDETITVIRAHGRRLAKLIRADGTIEDYDRARTVDLFEVGIADLAALESLLRRLEKKRECCVVRGAVVDAGNAVRRLLHPDPFTGDVPTLRDVPRRWVALDFDSLPRPQHVLANDVLACAGAALRALPEAFQETCCTVQATARLELPPVSACVCGFGSPVRPPVPSCAGGCRVCQSTIRSSEPPSRFIPPHHCSAPALPIR